MMNVRKLVLGLSLAIACQSALAQTMYRIKPIGNLDGCTSRAPFIEALNGKDQVTGYACTANDGQHAFVWKNDGTPMVDLTPFSEVGYGSEGRYINASGQVVGKASDSTGSFFFLSSGDGSPIQKIPTNGNVYALNDLGQVTGDTKVIPYTYGAVTDAFIWKNNGSPILDLGSRLEFTRGAAINASGQVAGWSSDSSDPSMSAFVWKNDGTPLLTVGDGGSACCINASGQVAGITIVDDAGYNYPARAFIWKNDGTTTIYNLGTLGGPNSYASTLNDAGQVAGWSDILHGLKPHAFIWLNNGTAMKDLGTFGGTASKSNEINASGQVTGYANLPGDATAHAFIWRNDGTQIQDLNTLLDPTDPLKPYVTLTNGVFINDIGDIVADGTDSRTGRSIRYLLQGTMLTLSPRSLAFNTTAAKTMKTVTMTNTSTRVMVISSIALAGTAAKQFTSTNNCGSSLVGHASCTIKVTFKSTTKGAKSASLKVNGGGGGLRTVTLTGGTGSSPATSIIQQSRDIRDPIRGRQF